jgi:hypothetical protein
LGQQMIDERVDVAPAKIFALQVFGRREHRVCLFAGLPSYRPRAGS